MRRTEATLLSIALFVAAMVGAILLLVDRGPGDGTPTESPLVEPGPAAPEPAVTLTAPVEDAPAPRVAGERDREARRDTGANPPTDGTLDVKIQLAANVAGRIPGGTLYIEEALTPKVGLPPDAEEVHRVPAQAFKCDKFDGVVYVEVPGVPFSKVGYRVRVFVPGYNGSEQTVRVTPDEPVPSVELTVTAASPLSIRLIDQRFDPYVGSRLKLVPVGLPLGRPIVEESTDNFGTAVFGNGVLAGDYDARVDDVSIETIHVSAPGFVRDDLDVRGQSLLLRVPRGQTLRVEVFDAIGWALEGAPVRITAVDTTENRTRQLDTDRNGVCTFEHVVPGRYSIDIAARGYQATGRTVTVPAEGEFAPVQFRIVRL